MPVTGTIVRAWTTSEGSRLGLPRARSRIPLRSMRATAVLRRTHPVDEFVDLGPQQLGLPAEIDRGGDDLAGDAVGLGGRLVHARDGRRHRLGALRRLVDVAC